MKEILAQDWDIITIQQASHLAIYYDQWEPSLKEYIGIIRSNCTNQNVTLAFKLAHAYWTKYNGSPYGVERYKALCEAVKRQVQEVGIDIIIPDGTAIQNARNTSLNTEHEFTRDGTHLCFGAGRYIAACTWFQILFAPFYNKCILGNPAVHTVTEEERQHPENKYDDNVDVTEENNLLCQKCAFYATLDLYNVTLVE